MGLLELVVVPSSEGLAPSVEVHPAGVRLPLVLRRLVEVVVLRRQEVAEVAETLEPTAEASVRSPVPAVQAALQSAQAAGSLIPSWPRRPA